MARIRTIKPEFFRHEGLQDIEAENPGACCMLVFAGLWGHCDKAGRFEWKPRTLKLDILPFLTFDMGATLDILWAAGYLRRYSVGDKDFGEIASFEKHQRISGKEAQEPEKHPGPVEYEQRIDGEAIEKQQGSQEGKGREGNKEGKGTDINVALRARQEQVATVFDHWRTTLGHDRAALDDKRSKLIANRLKDGYTAEQLCNAISGCALSPFHMGDNEHGRKYDGLDLILRDAAKVDQFIDFFENPLKPKQAAPRPSTYNDSMTAAGRAIFGDLEHGNQIIDVTPEGATRKLGGPNLR